MERSDAQAIYGKLDELGIAYRAVSHPPAYTMEDLYGVRETLGAAFCKNLFLTNRQKTQYFLLLIHEDKRFRTAEVSKKLDMPRLSFGDEDALYELLGVLPGAISPLGLVFDIGHKVTLVVDRDVLESEAVCLHPCVNTESVALATGDLFEVFIPHCGHKPVVLEITGKA